MEKNDRNVALKEFVDFAFSLKEMQEVKEKGFPIPKMLTFYVSKNNHESLQVEILKQKNLPITNIDINEEFEVEFYGINFKFLYK